MLSVLVATGDSVRYLSWGWLAVSLPNLVAITVTVVLVVLALVLPFPRDRRDPRRRP
ncbi:hypothetical protein [Cellulomonas sp. ICMP 17802]|uniref:hypothetical protein n=1 Tax=Cellulomonas sp. ICMP 17802 TaxID=3239199 RepID=UPI00351BC646